jgi:hypothetical protein
MVGSLKVMVSVVLYHKQVMQLLLMLHNLHEGNFVDIAQVLLIESSSMCDIDDTCCCNNVMLYNVNARQRVLAFTVCIVIAAIEPIIML